MNLIQLNKESVEKISEPNNVKTSAQTLVTQILHIIHKWSWSLKSCDESCDKTAGNCVMNPVTRPSESN